MPDYPKTREETSAPPEPNELKPLLERYWMQPVLDIYPVRSRRVHYVQRPDDEVMARANPGWDGPVPPETLVRYVDHLHRSGAPAPGIVPTVAGDLFVRIRDQVLSMETYIPGEPADLKPVTDMCDIGRGLAQIHQGTEDFPLHPLQNRPVADNLRRAFDRARNRPVGDDATAAVRRLWMDIQGRFAAQIKTPIPWLLCRGDVRNANTIVMTDGGIRFTDFDSAEYGPALLDLAITRVQWALGNQWRLLSADDMADVMKGYHAVRPLTEAEQSAFPLVWAAYYADRMTFLLHRRLQGNRIADIEALRAHVLGMPDRAIAIGEEMVRAVTSDE